VLTSNNITESGNALPREAAMAEYKAGPRKRAPTHPGLVVASQLQALNMTPYAAAPLIGVTKQALGNLVGGKAAVSPEMALRLGKFFGNGPELWANMQTDFDLWTAQQRIGPAIAKIKTVKAPATEE